MKDKKTGFTMVELLTALAIISLLIGVLLPALSAVRKAAKEAKQKAQITTLGLAISAFKDDYGDYPPSAWSWVPPVNKRYYGSQKLAEALLGWDLMGFHPNSAWLPDGTDGAGNMVYNTTEDNLKQRKGPYLELATTNAFRLGNSTLGNGLFSTTGPVAPEPFVICDVFGVKRIRLATGKAVIAGTPILYYKANTSSKSLSGSDTSKLIYDISDNYDLVALGRVTDGISHPLVNPNVFYSADYGVRDPKVTAPWPYRPDSYILISAGADGFYGTPDDIRNFGD